MANTTWFKDDQGNWRLTDLDATAFGPGTTTASIPRSTIAAPGASPFVAPQFGPATPARAPSWLYQPRQGLPGIPAPNETPEERLARMGAGTALMYRQQITGQMPQGKRAYQNRIAEMQQQQIQAAREAATRKQEQDLVLGPAQMRKDATIGAAEEATKRTTTQEQIKGQNELNKVAAQASEKEAAAQNQRAFDWQKLMVTEEGKQQVARLEQSGELERAKANSEAGMEQAKLTGNTKMAEAELDNYTNIVMARAELLRQKKITDPTQIKSVADDLQKLADTLRNKVVPETSQPAATAMGTVAQGKPPPPKTENEWLGARESIVQALMQNDEKANPDLEENLNRDLKRLDLLATQYGWRLPKPKQEASK